MNQRTKSIGLLYLYIAFAALLLLAVSLSNLQLQAGSPFPGAGNPGEEARAGETQPLAITAAYPILKGLLALIFSALSIYLIARLIALVEIKNILRLALAAAIILAIVYLLPSTAPNPPANISTGPSEAPIQPNFENPVSPLGQPPQYITWIVIVILSLGIGWLVFNYVRRWPGASAPGDPLLQEAEMAIDAIQSGVELKYAIMNCYFQMTLAIYHEQGIERQDAMTAREFERWLAIKGFPPRPVHQLTSLFEKVRYGTHQSSDQDEEIALDSLNEIVQFCRKERLSAHG